MAKLGRPFPPMTETQRKILLAISSDPTATMSEWAEDLGYSLNALTRLVNYLENKGYLTSKQAVKKSYKITEKAVKEL